MRAAFRNCSVARHQGVDAFSCCSAPWYPRDALLLCPAPSLLDLAAADSRVVDEAVNLPKLLQRDLDEVLQVGLLADVALDKDDAAAAERRNLLGNLLAVLRRPGVGKG